MRLVFGGRVLEVVFRRATAEDCPKVAEAERANAYRRGYEVGFGLPKVAWLSRPWHREPWDAFSEGCRDGIVAAHGEPTEEMLKEPESKIHPSRTENPMPLVKNNV